MTKITSRRDTTDVDVKSSTEEIANHQESSNRVKGNQPLRDRFVGLEVVHVTDGRVRIQAKTAEQTDLLSTVAKLFPVEDGFTSKTLNLSTRSLVVKFDPSQISTAVVLRILQKLGIPDVSASRHQIPEDPFATWKNAGFWREQGIDLIPLLLGLAVTGRLGINGFAAIPVYLITAEAARKVINYLQPQVSAFFATTSTDSTNPVKSKSSIPSPPANQNSKSKQQDRNKKPAKTSSSVEHRPKLSTQKLLTKEQSHTSIGSKDSSISCAINHSIVHAIPGRVRFNIPRVGTDRAYAQNLERLLKTDANVTSIRVNTSASSVAIAYKNHKLNISYWVDLMVLADSQTANHHSQNNNTNQQTTNPTKTSSNLSSQEVSPQARSGTSTTSPSMVVHHSPDENLAASSSTHVELATGDPETISDTISSPIVANYRCDAANLWADFKPPALSYSLTFMANFPLD